MRVLPVPHTITPPRGIEITDRAKERFVDAGQIEALRGIFETLAPLQYRQSALLSPSRLTILTNPKLKQLCIPNYLEYGAHVFTGECSQLMTTAHLVLKQRVPELHFLRAVGTEPRYFSDILSTHRF